MTQDFPCTPFCTPLPAWLSLFICLVFAFFVMAYSTMPPPYRPPSYRFHVLGLFSRHLLFLFHNSTRRDWPNIIRRTDTAVTMAEFRFIRWWNTLVPRTLSRPCPSTNIRLCLLGAKTFKWAAHTRDNSFESHRRKAYKKIIFIKWIILFLTFIRRTWKI